MHPEVRRMRREKWLVPLIAFLPLAVCITGAFACSPAVNKQFARTAIDVATAACVAENPWMSEKELQGLCNFADDVLPFVRELLGAQRKGMAKGQCTAPTTVKVTSIDAGK